MKKLLSLILSFAISIFMGITETSQVFAATPSKPTTSICSLPDVILGTVGDDILTGTEGDDIICGLGGVDTIDGLGGDDIIIGGDNIDTIIGGSGEDQIVGGIGEDLLSGGDGSDEIWGDTGNDTVDGGSEPDYIAGGPGADNLFGSAGSDSMYGEAGDDSLNGGQDLDILDGGTGSDVCQKQTGETTKSCFYDNYGPKLINVAIDPNDAQIDSTDPNRMLHIRFTISDAGTGLDSSTLTFSDSKQVPLFYSEAKLGQIRYGDLVTANSSNLPCQSPRPSSAYSCRVSGSDTYATYESAIALPRNMLTSTYRLVGFSGSDKVQNLSEWNIQMINSKKLGVSFKQVGVNDRSAPVITDFELYGDRNVATEYSTTDHFAKISFTDPEGSGLRTLSVEYQLLRDSKHHFYGGSNIDESVYGSPCPSDFTTSEVSCLISGNKFGGVLYLQFGFGGYNISGEGRLKKGLGKPWQVTSTDFLGNERTYQKLSKSLVAKNIVFESYGFDSDSDHEAPTLVSLTASKTRIDTISAPATIVFKWVAKDVGKGLDAATSTLQLTKWQDGHGNPGGTCDTPAPKQMSGGKYSFVTTCVIPAHYSQGELLIDISLNDKSANGNYSIYGRSELTSLGFPSVIVNG
jgi:hypothetical protein